MKTRLLFVLATLFFNLLIIRESLANQEEISVEISAEDSAGPWGMPDGRGCGNKLVVAAFKLAGVKAKLNIVPYARCKADVISGASIACFSMSTSSELAGKVVFAEESLYVPEAQVFVEKGSSFESMKIQNLKDIPATAKLAVVNGYEYPSAIVELLSKNKNTSLAKNEAAIFKMLKMQRIDFGIFMLDDLKTIQFLAKGLNLNSNELVRKFIVDANGSYLGFSMYHPLGRKIKDRFDQGYAKLIASGEKAKIIQSCKNGDI